MRDAGEAMNDAIRAELRRELLARGFSEGLNAPNGSIWFDEIYLSEVGLAELLETMVSKREKAFRAVDVLGESGARETFDDVVLVIEAIKVVIGRLED